MTKAARMILILNAIVIGSIGLAYLVDPNLLLANYGLSVGEVGMDNMLRSTYGGLFVAMAGLFALGSVKENRRRDALGLLALFMGGLAAGRIASLTLAGVPDGSMHMLLAYEATAFAVAVFLYQRTPAATAS